MRQLATRRPGAGPPGKRPPVTTRPPGMPPPTRRPAKTPPRPAAASTPPSGPTPGSFPRASASSIAPPASVPLGGEAGRSEAHDSRQRADADEFRVVVGRVDLEAFAEHHAEAARDVRLVLAGAEQHRE